MKAKEYARLYKSSLARGVEARTITGEIAIRFLKEMADLTKSRGIKTRPGVIGLMNELDQKWKAFCRLTLDHKPDGFEMIIKKHSPNIWSMWKSPASDQALALSFINQERKTGEPA